MPRIAPKFALKNLFSSTGSFRPAYRVFTSPFVISDPSALLALELGASPPYFVAWIVC